MFWQSYLALSNGPNSVGAFPPFHKGMKMHCTAAMRWWSVFTDQTVLAISVPGLFILCSNNCVHFWSLCVPIICLQLALYVLSFLEPRDLLRAAQTCRNWRFLAEDNLLWREKCREAGIDEVRETIHRRRQRVPSVTSPWKVSVLFAAHPRFIHVAKLCSY